MKATYLQAIKAGYLQGYNGLTYEGAEQHITDTEQATIQGHLKQHRQCICSTKIKSSQQGNGSQHSIYMTIYATGQIFND